MTFLVGYRRRSGRFDQIRIRPKRFRSNRIRNTGCRIGGMQDWRDVGKEGCIRGRMRDKIDAVCFRKGRMQVMKMLNRWDTGN